MLTARSLGGPQRLAARALAAGLRRGRAPEKARQGEDGDTADTAADTAEECQAIRIREQPGSAHDTLARTSPQWVSRWLGQREGERNAWRIRL